jgi:basic membrane protein A and related proteins
LRRSLRLIIPVVLLMVILIPGFLSACGDSSNQAENKKSVLNIGLLLASGGMGDKSFNDSAYKGLLDAQKRFNIRFETVNYASRESNLDTLRRFAGSNYDLIIGIAFENLETIKTLAAEFPRTHFAAIDVELGGDNVASIVYREQEADFLMGVLAAMITRTGKVGVIGGTDIPAIRRIISGFKQGAAYQDSRVQVLAEIAGTFSDPQIGYNMALKQYDQGVDLIHNAASKTGLGIIQAAQQVNKWTTGTSGDQRNLAPGNMLGNRPKRVDTAVEMIIEEVNNGAFKAGVRSLGLKEDGLSLGPFDESVVTTAVLDRLEELKQKIINGEIKVQAE